MRNSQEKKSKAIVKKSLPFHKPQVTEVHFYVPPLLKKSLMRSSPRDLHHLKKKERI